VEPDAQVPAAAATRRADLHLRSKQVADLVHARGRPMGDHASVDIQRLALPGWSCWVQS